jgi:hypothetical protein
MLVNFFDKEEILKVYIQDKQKETAKETARRLLKKGMSLEEIAECSPSLSMDELKEIEAEVMSLV